MVGALLVALLQPPLEVQPVPRDVHLRTMHSAHGELRMACHAAAAHSLLCLPTCCGCLSPSAQHAAAPLHSCLWKGKTLRMCDPSAHIPRDATGGRWGTGPPAL